MSNDNTQINAAQVPGVYVRDIDKNGAKTQVIAIDIGGAGAEELVTSGQNTMANSIPIVLASDHSTINTHGIGFGARYCDTPYLSSNPIPCVFMVE